jgi:hypothetical protein
MRAVLGIDSAWTLSQPSGVALAAEKGSAWKLVAVEASYQPFDAKADSTLPETIPSGFSLMQLRYSLRQPSCVACRSILLRSTYRWRIDQSEDVAFRMMPSPERMVPRSAELNV